MTTRRDIIKQRAHYSRHRYDINAKYCNSTMATHQNSPKQKEKVEIACISISNRAERNILSLDHIGGDGSQS